MQRVQKFIIVPFRTVKGRLQQAEMRQASTEAGARRLAEQMAGRFAAVAAYEVMVDAETGEMNDPREIVAYGNMPALQTAMVA